MNVTSSKDEIELRAGQWILRRDREDCSDADRAALEAWLAQDSRHREAYLSLDDAWDLTADLKRWNPRDGRIDPDLLADYAGPARAPARWQWPLLAASVLIVVAALGWLRFSADHGASYETPVGGYERVVLEDGSVLQMNTNTAIRAHLTDSIREVRLLRGEAHFDVARDSRRPFQVVVGKTIARAVGTAFSVRVKEDERMELLVTQGKVKLLSGGQEGEQSLIAAGQIVEAQGAKIAVATVAPTEMSRHLSWQTGQLVFDKQPLWKVAEEFNRYNRRQVRVASPDLTSLEMTGNFKATDLESFVAAVKSALGESGVAVQQDAQQIVIQSPSGSAPGRI